MSCTSQSRKKKSNHLQKRKMADTKFTIDASQALAQLDGIDRALGELEAKFRALPATIRAGFQSNVSGKFEQGVKQAESAVEGVKRELDGVSPKVTAAFNPKQAETYAKAVAGAEAAQKDFNKVAGQKPVDAFGGAGRGLGEVNKQAGLGASLFRSLAGAAAGAAAAFSFGDAIVSGVQLNAEYERIKTSLTVLLKDATKADALLGKLNQFAAETPFQTDEINRAATSLLAFGESEQTVIDRLREIGTLSAGTGKDFNELTSIYGKARVAGVLYAEDINQLVEAGIPIIQEFAKQMGVSEAQVKKLASEGKVGFAQLQTAFTNLTTGSGQFAGLLEAQSKTLAGTISTLRDAFSQRLREAFSGFSEIVKVAAKSLADFFGTTKSGSQVLEQERTDLLGVANQVRLTNVGTEERTIALNKLKAQYPEFLGQINSEKITNQELQPILDKINQSYIIRIALQKQQEKLQPLLEAQAEAELKLASARASTNQELVKGAEIAGVRLEKYDTERKQIEAVTEALRQQAKFGIVAGQREAGVQPLNAAAVALERINALRGASNDRSKLQEATEKKVLLAQQEQESVAEQLKKTYGDLFDLATKTPTTPQATPGAVQAIGKPGKSAADAAFDQRSKDLAIRRTLLNDLEEGLDKELETVRLHFDQLRLEYEKAGLDISALDKKQTSAEAAVFVSALDKQVDADAAALEEIKRIGDAYISDRFAKAEQIKVLRDNEIREANERANSIISAAQSAGVSVTEINSLQIQAEKELSARRIQAEIEYAKNIADAKRFSIEQQKRDKDAEIDLQEERGKQLVLIAQKSGAKQADVQKLQDELDRASKQARLQAEIEFQQALLAITDAADQEQISAIRSRIDLLKAQIETLKLSGIQTEGAKKKATIYDLLGIDIETDEGRRAADAIKQIQDQVIAGIQAMSAARTAAADQAVADAERLVQTKEDELDREIQLAETGFASNVTLKRQELEEAKKQREKAQDEQRKAQRAQILLDSALQVSGLATSAANIFKSLSSLGPFGVAAAIASIGVMFGAFAKAKTDALRATRARYGMSGFIDSDGIVRGKTHAQGGEKLEVERGEIMQVMKDGTRKRVEVVRRENAAKYMDLLRAANTGDKEQIAKHAFSLAGIDPEAVTATDAQSVIRLTVPRFQQDNVTPRLEASTTQNTSTTIINQGDPRQAAILEAILYELKQGRKAEQWTNDGKTRISGNVRTTFIK